MAPPDATRPDTDKVNGPREDGLAGELDDLPNSEPQKKTQPCPHLDEIGSKYPIREIGLSSIVEPADRMRALQDKKIDEFAKSMKGSGLINPITVRPKEGGGYHLVAGRHRLHAARQLKWASIKCWVKDSLDHHALALIEIDENLMRADLSHDELRAHLLKRKEIWARRKAEQEEQAAHDAPPVKKHGHRQAKGFAAATSAATGLTKSQINRIIAESKPRPVIESTPESTPTIADEEEPDDSWCNHLLARRPLRKGRRRREEIHREKFLNCIASLLFQCEVSLDPCEPLIDEITEEERNAGLKDLRRAISLLKRAEAKIKAIPAARGHLEDQARRDDAPFPQMENPDGCDP